MPADTIDVPIRRQATAVAAIAAATLGIGLLDVIERNAKAQSQVVEDLLDMSSIIRGRMRLVHVPVDLAKVVRAAVDVVAPARAGLRSRIGVHIDDSPLLVTGDAARLQQITW